MATEVRPLYQEEVRNAFEAKAKFMLVEWSLEWDPAGFYSDLNTDRAFTWYELGFAQGAKSALPDTVAKN
jgi:hypothetical protein